MDGPYAQDRGLFKSASVRSEQSLLDQSNLSSEFISISFDSVSIEKKLHNHCEEVDCSNFQFESIKPIPSHTELLLKNHTSISRLEPACATCSSIFTVHSSHLPPLLNNFTRYAFLPKYIEKAKTL